MKPALQHKFPLSFFLSLAKGKHWSARKSRRVLFEQNDKLEISKTNVKAKHSIPYDYFKKSAVNNTENSEPK